MNVSGRTLVFVLPLLLLCGSAAVHAQGVRGRTVSEPNRQPVADVEISAVDANGRLVGQAMSGEDGFFLLEGMSGRVMIHAARYGFLPDSQSVDVSISGDTPIPAFVLVPDAVVLDTLTATAERRRAAGTTGRRSRVVSGTRMAVLEQHGVDVATVAREIGPLRVRPEGWSYCIESNRRAIPFNGRGPACNMVAVIVNGFQETDPSQILKNLPLTAVESIEYLDPFEAGFRYGFRASAVGALVIWTRGRGPHASTARNWR